MRACGISLYRVAMPLLAFAALASALLFGLEERVLATPTGRQTSSTSASGPAPPGPSTS